VSGEPLRVEEPVAVSAHASAERLQPVTSRSRTVTIHVRAYPSLGMVSTILLVTFHAERRRIMVLVWGPQEVPTASTRRKSPYDQRPYRRGRILPSAGLMQ
jgi:hypothetical protein